MKDLSTFVIGNSNNTIRFDRHAGTFSHCEDGGLSGDSCIDARRPKESNGLVESIQRCVAIRYLGDKTADREAATFSQDIDDRIMIARLRDTGYTPGP